MPRLLVVTTLAGTLRAFLLPLARHFRAKGWIVDALAAKVTDSAECRAAFDHVWEASWSRNPLSPKNALQAVSRVREVVAEGQYDIVHVHTPIASFLTRLALSRLPAAARPVVIYTAHGFHFHRGGSALTNAAFANLERIAARWTDYLVVMNREDLAAATRLRLVPADRLLYMSGIGIDTAAYSPETVPPDAVAAIRAELGLSEGQPLFLMVAYFNRGKRHTDALKAFALLSQSAPTAHLVFAGGGRCRPACELLAARLGLTERVHFLGHRDDIPALIRASQATLLPSEREGLPRSIMESLSLEVPVIGSDIRGIRDLLADGAGLMYTVGDIKGLAAAMGWILGHPREAALMARRGREQLMAAGRSQADIISRHEELYAVALNRRQKGELGCRLQ